MSSTCPAKGRGDVKKCNDALWQQQQQRAAARLVASVASVQPVVQAPVTYSTGAAPAYLPPQPSAPAYLPQPTPQVSTVPQPHLSQGWSMPMPTASSTGGLGPHADTWDQSPHPILTASSQMSTAPPGVATMAHMDRDGNLVHNGKTFVQKV